MYSNIVSIRISSNNDNNWEKYISNKESCYEITFSEYTFLFSKFKEGWNASIVRYPPWDLYGEIPLDVPGYRSVDRNIWKFYGSNLVYIVYDFIEAVQNTFETETYISESE